MRTKLPTGTVTFLFTDVEGSTKLLHDLGAEAYDEALSEHRRALREAFTAHGGVEVDTQGDAFFYAFPTPEGGLQAAGEGQAALAAGPIAVRMGLHTGTPHIGTEGYIGDDVHLAARVASTGHGGQVVLSKATAELVELELTDLGEHRLKGIPQPVPIYQLGNGSFPPLKTISNTNLPRPASSFVGREEETADIVTMLRNGARLVTLSGPGGTGKTRLSIEAAAELVPDFKAGVFWVGLASLRDPALVTVTIAQTLGAKDSLADHIEEREMLLLLDNFEQVIDCAPELSELLSICPNLRLLVTSRELLRVRGEVEYAVPPLAESEAVELFCARSQLDPDDTIAELCRRLDDMPLAVELAAARTSVLTPQQIVERLSRRLDLLEGGRDADPRQQTLRATIEWSYDLLSAEEQQLFARLSVFVGGCTLEAAEDVCDADLDSLQSLVHKSLLRFTDSRYWMLETIREFAADASAASPGAEKLGRRHAEHYLRLALEAEPELTGAAQALWLDRLGEEHDNLRAALDWSLTADPEVGLRTAVSLARYWQFRGYVPEARNYFSALFALDPSPELRALALRDMTGIAADLGEWDDVERYAEERGRLCRELGDEEGANQALLGVAWIAEVRGDLDRANAVYQEVLARARELGLDVGLPLNCLGDLARNQGRFSDAEALYEEALASFESVGDDAWVAVACLGLGAMHVDQGHLDMARAPLRRSLSLTVSLRSPVMVSLVLDIAALAATDAKSAARLLGKSDEVKEETGEPRPPQWTSSYEQAAAAAVDALGEEQFEAAYDEGRELSLEDAVALALEVIDA
jgi:predicted ATPase